jgi:iron complex transport system substrate-binding protein
MYGFLPYNYHTTNVDTAIADAYYMGTEIFPSAFEGVDPVARADEIYTFLVGRPMYGRMATDFGGFKKLDLTSP